MKGIPSTKVQWISEQIKHKTKQNKNKPLQTKRECDDVSKLNRSEIKTGQSNKGC